MQALPRLWATRRVGWLLDEMRMHGESAELRGEVIRLARELGPGHTIVTVLTDYESVHVAQVNVQLFPEHVPKPRRIQNSS